MHPLFGEHKYFSGHFVSEVTTECSTRQVLRVAYRTARVFVFYLPNYQRHWICGVFEVSMKRIFLNFSMTVFFYSFKSITVQFLLLSCLPPCSLGAKWLEITAVHLYNATILKGSNWQKSNSVFHTLSIPNLLLVLPPNVQQSSTRWWLFHVKIHDNSRISFFIRTCISILKAYLLFLKLSAIRFLFQRFILFPFVFDCRIPNSWNLFHFNAGWYFFVKYNKSGYQRTEEEIISAEAPWNMGNFWWLILLHWTFST